MQYRNEYINQGDNIRNAASMANVPVPEVFYISLPEEKRLHWSTTLEEWK